MYEFKAEYSKSGRSRCKICDFELQKHQLRLVATIKV